MKAAFRVLLIEDDYRHAEELKQSLEQLGVCVDILSTELQFLKRLAREDVRQYSLAVVNMMLRWTDPSPRMELPPKEILEEGSYMAGLRCCRKLGAEGVRCVVFTALSPERIGLRQGDEIEIIHKDGAGYKRLLVYVTRLRVG